MSSSRTGQTTAAKTTSKKAAPTMPPPLTPERKADLDEWVKQRARESRAKQRLFKDLFAAGFKPV